MKRLLLLCFLLCMSGFTALAQLTYPSAHNLGSGPYSFTDWASTNAALTYPPNMILHKYSGGDAFATVLNGNWVGTYALTSGARINVLGTDGLQFANTGTSNHVGAAVVALNTQNRSSIAVSFTSQLLAHLTPTPPRRECV